LHHGHNVESWGYRRRNTKTPQSTARLWERWHHAHRCPVVHGRLPSLSQAESCMMMAVGSHNYRPQTPFCPIIFIFITNMILGSITTGWSVKTTEGSRDTRTAVLQGHCMSAVQYEASRSVPLFCTPSPSLFLLAEACPTTRFLPFVDRTTPVCSSSDRVHRKLRYMSSPDIFLGKRLPIV
jgi:hypothetical protein